MLKAHSLDLCSAASNARLSSLTQQSVWPSDRHHRICPPACIAGQPADCDRLTTRDLFQSVSPCAVKTKPPNNTGARDEDVAKSSSSRVFRWVQSLTVERPARRPQLGKLETCTKRSDNYSWGFFLCSDGLPDFSAPSMVLLQLGCLTTCKLRSTRMARHHKFFSSDHVIDSKPGGCHASACDTIGFGRMCRIASPRHPGRGWGGVDARAHYPIFGAGIAKVASHFALGFEIRAENTFIVESALAGLRSLINLSRRASWCIGYRACSFAPFLNVASSKRLRLCRRSSPWPISSMSEAIASRDKFMRREHYIIYDGCENRGIRLGHHREQLLHHRSNLKATRRHGVAQPWHRIADCSGTTKRFDCHSCWKPVNEWMMRETARFHLPNSSN